MIIVCNGKKPETSEINDILAKWIKDLRDEKIPVNTNDIIVKMNYMQILEINR